MSLDLNTNIKISKIATALEKINTNLRRIADRLDEWDTYEDPSTLHSSKIKNK